MFQHFCDPLKKFNCLYDKFDSFWLIVTGSNDDVFKASTIKRATCLLAQLRSYTHSRWPTWLHRCLLLKNGTVQPLYCMLCSLVCTWNASASTVRGLALCGSVAFLSVYCSVVSHVLFEMLMCQQNGEKLLSLRM